MPALALGGSLVGKLGVLPLFLFASLLCLFPLLFPSLGERFGRWGWEFLDGGWLDGLNGLELAEESDQGFEIAFEVKDSPSIVSSSVLLDTEVAGQPAKLGWRDLDDLALDEFEGLPRVIGPPFAREFDNQFHLLSSLSSLGCERRSQRRESPSLSYLAPLFIVTILGNLWQIAAMC